MEKMTQRRDEIAVLRSGREDAFEDLFRRHSSSLFRFARRLTDNTADAEEAVQDSFVTLWTKRNSIVTADGSVLPWLLVTCRHHCRNLIRKRRRHQTTDLTEMIEKDYEDELSTPEWLMSELDALSPVDRALVMRCLLEGMPYRRVADELGLTVGAVTKRIQRMRNRLRVAMTERKDEW